MGQVWILEKAQQDTLNRTYVFLHLVQSVDHLVCSVASKARNIDAIFLMLRWAQCASHKKRAGACYIRSDLWVI
jgi:hypothetical protein